MSDANLYSMFRERFAPRMDAPCFILTDGRQVTFGALDDLSARFAALLRRYGATEGERVVAQIDKSVAAFALYLACLRTGAIYVPLNTAYTAAEVDYFIQDAEPVLFVGAVARETSATHTVVLGETEDTPLWRDALAATPDHALAPRGADDIAAILYTSGTTGRSKGAMLSIGNLASNALTLHRLWGFGPNDVLIHALPIFHVHGLFVAMHCALLNVTPTYFLPKFDPAQVRELLPRATVLMGVPTFYTRLLGIADFGVKDCARMRLFISGSAPLLAETHRAFEARTGHRILERYGMTESGMITSNPLNGERVPGTVGFALPDVAVRVADDAGQVLQPGEPGVGQRRERLDPRRRADVGQQHAVGVGGHAGGQKGDADPGDVLREAQGHGEQPEQKAHRHAGQRRQQHAGPQVCALVDREPAHHGAQGHDALDAEVQHARPLAQQLAQRREDQGRGNAQGRGPEARLQQDVQDFAHGLNEPGRD